MKHAGPAQITIPQKRRGPKVAGILLALALVAAAVLGGMWYVKDQQEKQEAQRVAAASFAAFTESALDTGQAAIEAEKKRIESADKAEEEAWLASLDEERRAKIEAARVAAIEAAHEEAIEAARIAYEEDVVAQRDRLASDFGDVLMVGDSVMEYATGQIYGQFPGATLNALGGRSLEMGPPGNNYDPSDGVMDILRAHAGAYGRYVVGTGNNEGSGLPYDVGAEIVSLAGEDATVYFITQTTFANTGSMEVTNATIAALCEEHDNVRAIDWHAATLENGGLVMADGVHPTQAGVAAYVGLIYDALTSYDPPAFDPDSVPFDPDSVPFDPQAVDLGPEITDEIMGTSAISAASMAQLYQERGVEYPADVYADAGAPTIDDFCALCVEEAGREGVRAEVLFAQAMHETAWLQFGNQVSVEQNNFGGLGAVNSGGAGEVFDDVRTGLRAQVQHLKAYASTDDVKSPIVDTRFELVERGCAPTVFDLGGRWAWPGDGYGDAIMGIVKDLYDREYGASQESEELQESEDAQEEPAEEEPADEDGE